MPGERRYLLENRQAGAGARLEALSRLFDPVTQRHLRATGLKPGARTWEVGAGGSALVDWLAAEVGAGGTVWATDIDPRWVARPGSHVKVEAHDVVVDPVPEGAFDLVHARLVLVHLPDRRRALAQMTRALAPGGWLVVEDADPGLQPLACPDEWGPEQQLANRVKAAFRVLLAGRGADLAFGRTLPRLLREAGLSDVEADAYFPVGGPACDELERATVVQTQEALVSTGLVTEADVERHLANVDAGRLDVATSPLVSAWGRKRPSG